MRVGAIVALAVLCCAASSHALPVTYGFSVRASATFAPVSVASLSASERAYLLAHPGEATPGWSGTLSYDSDSGAFGVSLVAPLSAAPHVVDFGGSSLPGFAGDFDSLDLALDSPSPIPRIFELFGTDDLYYWSGSSQLVLVGPGLVVDGQLSHNLTVDSLTDAYLYLFPASLDAPALMHAEGCPAELSLLECAYAGYHIYLNDSSTLMLSIAEIHEIPEPSVSLFVALALGLAVTGRGFARLSA